MIEGQDALHGLVEARVGSLGSAGPISSGKQHGGVCVARLGCEVLGQAVEALGQPRIVPKLVTQPDRLDEVRSAAWVVATRRADNSEVLVRRRGASPIADGANSLPACR